MVTPKEAWLRDLLSGEIEEDLYDLTLIKGENMQNLGEGRLKWKRAKGLSIETSVMQKDYGNFYEDIRQIFHRSPPPGKLATEKDKCTIRSKTEKKGEFEVEVLPMIDRMTSSILKLCFQPTETVKIKKSIPVYDTNQFYGVVEGIDHKLFPWNRLSKVQDANPLFGRKKSTNDWSQVQINELKIGIRKSGEGKARIAVVNPAKQDNSLERWAQAFVKAMSFVNGQQIHLIGFEYKCSDSQLFALTSSHNQKENRGNFYPPFGSSISLNTPEIILNLISTMTAKLMENQKNYKHLIDLLGICHQASDSYAEVKALVSAIVLEGLLTNFAAICNKLPPYQDEHKDQIDDLKAYVVENENFTESFRNRMCGLFGSIQNPRAQDILENIQEKNLFAISKKEINAWNEVRHSYAHGSFKPLTNTRKFQKVLSNLACVANLINKLLLYIFDYHGSYRDYASPGYPEKQLE